MKIKAAEYKYYNANNRGNVTGDCVKRAISLAFDASYADVAKLLNDKMHQKRKTQWNIKSVYGDVIKDLGGDGYKEIISEKLTVDDFADNNPSGSFCLLVGPNTNRHDHLVCVRDGQVWDSWDCRQYYVHGYWKATGSKELRKIDKLACADYANNYLEPVVCEELLKYANKKNWTYSHYSVEPKGGTYKVVVDCTIVLEKDDVITKDRKYDFRIMLTIEPTWSDEEIIDFINKTGKIRTYDRMYAINDQEKKLLEAYEVINQAEGPLKMANRDYMTDQELRFVNSLPGWVMPLIKNVKIQQPRQWPDSYLIEITKHPKDTLHPKDRSFLLQGWDASDIKRQLDIYHDSYEIEGIDYTKDW